MSWLVPSAFGIAGVAAAIAVVLHFIARSRPAAEVLPTARFVPEQRVYARTRSVALTDLMLLLLRVAAILVIGAAVAGPVLQHRGRVARMILVDRSRAVLAFDAVRDTVKALARPGDIVIPFDSSADVGSANFNIDSLKQSSARASLSAGLAAATRAAVAARADSVELVVVSPFAREELDAATLHIRSSWPGRIGLVATPGVETEPMFPRVEVRADANDAVAATLGLLGVVAPSAPIRLVRGRVTGDDSLWASTDGHVLIHWPESDSSALWPRRAQIDAIGAVASVSATVVARFPRLWVLNGFAVARWADGEPAAVEHAVGNGCIRDVGVLVDKASDLTLRAPFRGFARSMLEPCGGARVTGAIGQATRDSLAGTGSLAAASKLRDRSVEASAWTPWLLGFGALLLIAELAVRRMRRATA